MPFVLEALALFAFEFEALGDCTLLKMLVLLFMLEVGEKRPPTRLSWSVDWFVPPFAAVLRLVLIYGA